MPADAGVAIPDAQPPDAQPPPPPACSPPSFGGRPVVYAHGPARPIEDGRPAQDFLAVIDADSREVVEWIPLACADEGGGYLDLAVTGDGRIMLAGANVFAWIDPETYECTTVRAPVTHLVHDEHGEVVDIWVEMVETPNNLTFVPPGVLDPTREMMAGFGYRMVDHQRSLYESGFMRYAADTALPELVYEWPNLQLGVSGDLVVVLDPTTCEPRSFATLTGSRETTRCHACRPDETPGVDCGDCLYEIDVRTGRVAREVALLPAHAVFGLALFGNALYGFSAGDFFARESGKLLAIEPGDGSAEILEIPFTPPEGYSSVHWHGAGSTVEAPILF